MREVSFGLSEVEIEINEAAFNRGFRTGQKHGYARGFEVGVEHGAKLGFAQGYLTGKGAAVPAIGANRDYIIKLLQEAIDALL